MTMAAAAPIAIRAAQLLALSAAVVGITVRQPSGQGVR
jgi:hypothetical protein